jgi:hypothetical protein
MAEWKKVIVSGSNISQLNNDAGYLTAVTQQNTFATMSVNGVAVLADNAVDTVTFASSSGAGLNITGDAGTDTITFALGGIPNASLANSAITVTSGNGLTGGGSTSLGGSTTLNVGAGSHITVNADDVAVNTTTLTPVIWAASASYTGSIVVTSAMILDGTIVNNDIASNAAIAYTKLSFAGSSFVSASSLSSAAQGEVVLTTNGVAGSTVDLGLQTTDSPQFVGLTLSGDLAVNGGDITTTAATATLFNANATTVNAFGATTTLNLGASTGTTTIKNDLIVSNNATITGNLTVNGTTTYVNVTDLYVEDKFILLASGSAAASDGGIIIDRGSDAAGNIAYGFDSATDRWGYQSGVTDTTNALDPTSANGVSGSFAAYVFTEASHGATKPVTGEFAKEGAIYTSTAGDIWMYA